MKNLLQVVVHLGVTLLLSAGLFLGEAKAQTTAKYEPKSDIHRTGIQIRNVQDRSQALATKAEALRKQGNYQGALLEYDNAIALDPSNYKLWLRKGYIYSTLKDWANAIISINKAVELKNNYVKGYLILLKIHLQNRDIDSAVEALDKAYKYDTEVKNKIRYKTQIITLLNKTNNLEKAGKHLQQIKQLAGNHPRILFYDAKYANLNGKHQNAIQSANKALEMLMTNDPQKTAVFYYELGYAYHHLGKYKEAHKYLQKANYGKYKALVFKMSPTYYYKQALAYYQIYQYKKCDELLNIALRIKPDHTSSHNLKVKLASKQVNQIALAESLKKSIEAERLDDRKAQKWAQLSEIYYKSQNYSRALSAANQSLKLRNNPSLALLKAMTYYEIEQNEKGVSTIKHILMTEGKNQNEKAKYLFALGLFYERIGNLKLAINNYKKAVFGDFRYVAAERLESLKKENI